MWQKCQSCHLMLGKREKRISSSASVVLISRDSQFFFVPRCRMWESVLSHLLDSDCWSMSSKDTIIRYFSHFSHWSSGPFNDQTDLIRPCWSRNIIQLCHRSSFKQPRNVLEYRDADLTENKKWEYSAGRSAVSMTTAQLLSPPKGNERWMWMLLGWKEADANAWSIVTGNRAIKEMPRNERWCHGRRQDAAQMRFSISDTF